MTLLSDIIVNPSCVYIIINEDHNHRIEVHNLIDDKLYSLTKTYAYIFLKASSYLKVRPSSFAASKNPDHHKRVIYELLELNVLVRKVSDCD